MIECCLLEVWDYVQERGLRKWGPPDEGGGESNCGPGVGDCNYQCCSPGVTRRCGLTSRHCKCPECVDFRNFCKYDPRCSKDRIKMKKLFLELR